MLLKQNIVADPVPVGARFEILPTVLAATTSAGVLFSLPVPRGATVVIEAEVWTLDPTAGDKGFNRVLGYAKNVAGTVTLTGSPVIDAFQADASHVVTVAANNTDKTVDVVGTADVTNATTFFGRVVAVTL